MKSLLGIILFNLLLYSFNCSFQESIFNELNKLNNGKNLIISPLSIFQILSLTTNGAKGNTQKQMLEALQIDDIEELNEINYSLLETFKKFTTVEVASAVMSKFEVLEDFSNICKKYSAPFELLKSAEQVNGWCSKKTHGKITKILDELKEDIRILLLNAVYFKADWIQQFDINNTKKKDFFNLGKEKIKLDTMTKLDYQNYYQDETVQAVELPYKNDSMSAIIILPSKEADINKYISSLANSKGKLSSIINGLRREKVHLEIPKLELDYSTSLKETLEDMGMITAFSDYADFTGLNEEESIKIDDVIHKTYLKVDEVGTEAAAITVVIGVETTSIDGHQEIIYEMKVNRPFLFLLRNKNLPADYDMLFMSKIEKLVKEEQEEQTEQENDPNDFQIEDQTFDISDNSLFFDIKISRLMILFLGLICL